MAKPLKKARKESGDPTHTPEQEFEDALDDLIQAAELAAEITTGCGLGAALARLEKIRTYLARR